MPLPPPVPKRTLRHARAIRVEAYERDDGLWDIEARLTDTKPEDVRLSMGVRPAGEPVHDMWLRVTIDTDMNVVAALAVSDSVPYTGTCEAIGPRYDALVGLNLLKGFRQGVRERMGGTAGCTHISELTGVLPTAAVQAFASTVYERRGLHESQDHRPFQLDRCHALRVDGEAVRRYYPRWFTGRPTDSADQPRASGPALEFQRIEG